MPIEQLKDISLSEQTSVEAPKRILNSYLPKKIPTAPKAATLTTTASVTATIKKTQEEEKDDSKVLLIQGIKRVVPKVRLDRALKKLQAANDKEQLKSEHQSLVKPDS